MYTRVCDSNPPLFLLFLTHRTPTAPVCRHTPPPQKRGGKSALLVAKEGGRVVGCVGLETRVIRDGQVTKLEAVKGDVRCDVCMCAYVVLKTTH